jgi:ubiquinone biosynthesis protein
MINDILKNRTHLHRYREIAEVLARHGLGFFLSVFGLDRFIPVRALLLGNRQPATKPEQLRIALEELGATFIKFGQVLSTRADLLPVEYQAELSKLQDAAPSVPIEVIRGRVEEELGKSIEDLFADFDDRPLAAASIGQAHAARLHSGIDVVVKVRRAGVVEQVEEDLEILQNLAASAARRWEVADSYDLVGLAQEFAATMRAELDYINEGRNAERFALNFRNDASVHIPNIFWELSTSRVLTLERIRGMKVDDRAALDAAGVDRKKLAERAAGMVLKMIFEDGFFHADPHPGNFFIESDGVIGLIDFGMVGAVDELTRERLASLLVSIASRDRERMVDLLLELGITRRKVDREMLAADLEHLLARYYGKPLGNLRIGDVMGDALALVRSHNLRLPPNLALLVKTTVMAESVGARLDPSFHLTSAIIPFADQMLIEEHSPRRVARKLKQAGVEMARLGVELPHHIRRIAGEIERGEVEVGVRPEGFEPIIERLTRLANRIVLGVIAAAFINGLAVLVSVYQPPGWGRWAGFAFAFGFIVAAAIGLYLAWTILRSRP